MCAKKKALLIGILLLCLAVSIVKAPYITGSYVISSVFSMEFYEGDTVGFQSDKTLLIEVQSAILNGSSCSLRLYENGGSLTFYAENNSFLEVSSPDTDNYELSVTGVSDVHKLPDSMSYAVAFNAGQTPHIQWVWRLESWLDKYTIMALGLVGLGFMVGSPTWVGLKIRQKGFDSDTVERFAYGLLVFMIGLGLLIIWLWS